MFIIRSKNINTLKLLYTYYIIERAIRVSFRLSILFREYNTKLL